MQARDWKPLIRTDCERGATRACEREQGGSGSECGLL